MASSISAIAPIISAVGGLLGNFMGGKEEKAAAPPPLPQEPVKEPEGAKDQDAARIRALKRREQAQIQGGLLNLKSEDEDNLLKKTLLGD